ncbi:hypothetical protein [Flaviaesturariibacter amylovorans]|uniref:Uncharacterized protein n=1 Tax=Flaviaesturariibacter amylovorans TaxID=1084520 RepID=A0ABP8HMS7_9BACT
MRTIDNPADIRVFRTNLGEDAQLRLVQPLLDAHPAVRKWNVDRHDVDQVLRVVVLPGTLSEEIIRLVQEAGCECEELPD